MSELPNTDQQPSIGKMGRISLESINTLAGLSILSVAKVNGSSISQDISGPTGSPTLFTIISNKLATDIIIDSLDNIYTYNSDDNSITKVTPGGTSSIFVIWSDLSPGSTQKMTIDSSDNIYVPLSNADIVKKVTPTGVVTTYGTTDTSPFACAFDSNDNLFVVNGGSNNITKITPGGTSSVFANVGTSPQDIVIDSSNNLYVVNSISNNISKVTPGGTSSIFANLGSGIFGYSIKMDSKGNLYVVDFDNTASVVKKITPAGTVSTFVTLGAWCQEITIDDSDNLFINSRESNFIYKITPGGTSSVYATTGNKPYGIAIDSLGYKYTINYFDSTITKIS